MTTTSSAIKTLINSLQVHLEDVRRVDIDGNDIGFRASMSYWIDEGWFADRWRDYGLPQVSAFQTAGTDLGAHLKSKGSYYEQVNFQIDVLGSGRQQMNSLAQQVKNALFDEDIRNSLNSSGLKMDRLLSETDLIEDEILPQQIFRKQLTIRAIFHTSGS